MKQRSLIVMGIACAGLATVAALARGDPQKAVVGPHRTSQSAVTKVGPVSNNAPTLTVNGVAVPIEEDGTKEVSLPTGGARVQVQSGGSTVTNTTNEGGTAAITTDDTSVKLNVSSHNSGGTSRSHTSIQSSTHVEQERTSNERN